MLSMLATQIPVILASLAGLIVVLTRWKQLWRAAPWALAGFGLSLALCVIIPVGQALLQAWVIEHGAASATWVFAVTGFGWAFLHAAVLVALMVAVCAGRVPAVPSVTAGTGAVTSGT